MKRRNVRSNPMDRISELPQRISDPASATVVLSESDSDRISELPKEILHRILYFLTQQQAVRTSVLSKSWRDIGCTRPNLEFSSDRFMLNKLKFISIVNDSLQRYRDQRFSLEEFHLSIGQRDPDRDSVSLLEKWIPLLTVMGVKKFCLSIHLDYNTVTPVRLPPVVFGAESLQDLHVRQFMLDQEAIQRIVNLKHLKKLDLQRVLINDEIFQKIISRCPLVENMSLNLCRGLRNIKVNNHCHLKKFSLSETPSTDQYGCCVETYPPSLKIIYIEYGNISFHERTEFCNLKDLHLISVKSSLDHLSSCKFPSLKRLTLSECDGLKEIQLVMDAPNIYDFEYRGNFIPSITFTTTSRSWDSYIYLTYVSLEDGSSWFFKLNELLKSLSKSTINLSITEYSMTSDIIQENIHLVRHINGGNIPVVAVESLVLDCNFSSSISCFLNGAFSICRPRLIGEYCSHSWKIHHIKCLWKILMQREHENQGDQFRQLLLQDLEEVRFELKESNRKGWHPITLSELPKYQQKEFNQIRFKLKWRETAAKIQRKWWEFIDLCIKTIILIIIYYFILYSLLHALLFID